MQNLTKYIKFMLKTQHHGSVRPRSAAGDLLRMVVLLVTDRLLYPDQYGRRNLPARAEIMARNQHLLKVFADFYGNNQDYQDYRGYQGYPDYSDYPDIDHQKLILLLNKFSPRELLHIPGMVHEALLTVSQASKISRRKYQGSYYTPIHIVQHMVDKALPYTPGAGLKIIDPACGGGSFLLEAWYALTERGYSETEAALCIFGLDIDKTAVQLSNYLLSVAVWAKSRQQLDLQRLKGDWEKRIGTADALKAIYPFEFDLVIGNPPYVANKLIGTEEKKYYRNHFLSAKGQFDLSVPFIEQGLRLLKKDGILSYITSNKFLAADYGKEIRRIILARNRLKEIIDVSMLNSFADTAAYPVIVTLARSAPSAADLVKLAVVSDWQEVENHAPVKEPVKVSQDIFLQDRDYLISTCLDTSILPLVLRLETLEKLQPQKIRCGLAITGFNKWIVRNPETKGSLLSFLQAGNIRPYRVESHDYIETGHFSENKVQGFSGVKLVIPGIATALKAAIDFSGSILGRVYYIKQDETTLDLNFLVVLFNSQVLNFYYKVKYWAVHLAGGYLRFNSGYLANLPLPMAADQTGQMSSQRELAEKITELGRVLSGTQASAEPLEITESRAEALVFAIYGLNLSEADTIMQFNGLNQGKREKIIEMLKEVGQWTKPG